MKAAERVAAWRIRIADGLPLWADEAWITDLFWLATKPVQALACWLSGHEWYGDHGRITRERDHCVLCMRGRP